MSQPTALQVLAALRDLGREERALIDQGHVEGLAELAPRRLALVAALESAGGLRGAGPELAELVAAVRAEGEGNIALLRALQDDISQTMGADRHTGHALASYGNVSHY